MKLCLLKHFLLKILLSWSLSRVSSELHLGMTLSGAGDQSQSSRLFRRSNRVEDRRMRLEGGKKIPTVDHVIISKCETRNSL